MRYVVLLISLLLAPASALACDTFTSAQKAPGERVLTDLGVGLTLAHDGLVDEYTTSSAGTGTGIRVAFMDGQEPLQIDRTDGQFWLGPEMFTEYCQ
jgi:hypothetical protein